MDSVEFSILGLEELTAKLYAVTDETKGKTGRSALLKAAQLVAIAAADEWRALDDAETGQSIADNIVKRGQTPKGNSTTNYPGVRWGSKRFKSTGDINFRIGVAGGAKTDKEQDKDKSAGSPTPHWRLIEFGTERIGAKPIMRNALSQNISQATDTFISQYQKKLDAAIKKAKKAKRSK